MSTWRLVRRFPGVGEAVFKPNPGPARALIASAFPPDTPNDCRKIREVERVLKSGKLPRPELCGSRPNSRREKSGNPAKVIHALHNSLPFDQAGYAIRSHGVIKAQTQLGIEIYPYTRSGYPNDLKRRADEGITDEVTPDGIKYHRLSRSFQQRARMTEQEYISYYAQDLIAAAKVHGSNIFHGHSNFTNGLAAAWAAKWTGKASIYEVRGLWHITRASSEPAFRHTKRFQFHQIMELEAMRQVDAIVTISSQLKQWMVNHGIDEKKISVIANGVDTEKTVAIKRDDRLSERFNLQDKVVIGYAGSLVPYEGLDSLIKAFDICRQNGLNIALMIVGDGGHENYLRQLADSTASSADIHFTGKVKPLDISAYLSLFDICPLPRPDIEVCRLVPPLKPLELMASEKALLVSALPALLDFGEVGKSTISFIPGDLSDLADKISDLALNTSKRAELGQLARKWVVKNGNWRDKAESYLKLYRKLLAS